jgi:hypothetical protein
MAAWEAIRPSAAATKRSSERSGKPVGAAAAGVGETVASDRTVPLAAAVAAWVRKRRRVADVFVGGVLCTRAALAMVRPLSMVEVRAGVNTYPLPLGSLFV